MTPRPGDHKGAGQDYNRAVQYNPEYARTHIKPGIDPQPVGCLPQLLAAGSGVLMLGGFGAFLFERMTSLARVCFPASYLTSDMAEVCSLAPNLTSSMAEACLTVLNLASDMAEACSTVLNLTSDIAEVHSTAHHPTSDTTEVGFPVLSPASDTAEVSQQPGFVGTAFKIVD